MAVRGKCRAGYCFGVGAMRVLVACEYSQIVTQAFRDRGHEAFSCDILPTEGNPDWHFQCNIFCPEVWDFNWELIIGHPPCTRLTNAGVRWLHERDLWDDLEEACEFFNRLKSHKIDTTLNSYGQLSVLDHRKAISGVKVLQ